ncbi:diguanylate cyclase [Opitutus sp. GAS368]|uniref:GGDEF domain-containing response regulator n=1 Tax=Opitutus sp. GAS368 TaxID=1882749 RepID=UPI00087D211A|nr:diguanylate cyclase [Opitutus sp. GAS368]SDR67503.1 diguanylate cyclase (GGDEF) domain-containing protein [Opitutus sp. GAS368]
MPTTIPPKVRRILLIDDDRLQQRLMQGLVQNFRGGAFELDGAQTYAEGLKKLLSGKYAVCLLDYRLDAQDGLALLREARIAGGETPVIILTADDSEEVDIAAMEAGAVDYLVKATINPRLLERSIRYALKLGETLAQLRQLAQRDELTRLLNRREFSRILNEEWDRSVRFKRPFALVMVDIDHFKKINDTHGHQVGDEVLRHVASLLAGQVRTVDRVARYGGEEFALIMIETDGKNAAEHIKRLGVLLAETPCFVESKNLTVEVTLSAGVATSIGDATSATDLVGVADKALYAAKKGGRNRIVMADGTVIPFK